MKNRLSLPVRTKLSLFVSVLSNLVLFFALLTTPQESNIAEASAPSVISDNLEVYYDITQSGTLANQRWEDLSGNQNNATVASGIVYNPTSGILTTSGSAADRYIDTNFTPSITSGFTATIFYQRIGTASWDILWANELWSAGLGYVLAFTGADQIAFFRGGDQGGPNEVVVNDLTNIDKLNEYTVTLEQIPSTNSGIASIYINGVFRGSGTINITSSYPTDIKLNSRHENALVDGHIKATRDQTPAAISSFLFYNDVLTTQEIESNFQAISQQTVDVVLTFDSYGAGSISPIIGSSGDAITLPNLSRTNYLFAGWYTDNTYTTKVITNTLPAQTTTYYARWLTYEDFTSGIIRIDKDKVDDDLTNFPVTIVLNSGNFDFSLVQSSGADIFFTDVNDNLLPFEVDYFNHASGIAVYHVLYSGVITSGIENQDILIRYGEVENYYYDFSDGYQSSGVWKNGYVLVMHMGENLVDSVGSGVTNIVNNGTTIVLSDLGNARSFDGNDYISLGDLPLPSNHTILVSLNFNNVNGRQDFISSHDNQDGYGFFLNGEQIVYSIGNGSSFTNVNTSVITANTDVIVTGTLGQSGQSVFLNGNSIANNGNTSLGQNDQSLTYLGRHATTSDQWYFNGEIDEVRLSNVTRSSGWVKAEYYAITGELAMPVYTVSFETNSGTSISPITGYAGSGISPVTTRSGYEFDGWYTDSGLTTPAATPLTIPMGGDSLYAKWDAATYVVTFENSGVFVSSGNVTYDAQYGTLPTVT